MFEQRIHHTETEFRYVSDDGRVLLKGTPDSVIVLTDPSCVIVRERKFGFKEVQPANANFQLRCYLAMVADVYPAEDYFGCLTQPRISSKPNVVHYLPADIVKARAEIEAIHAACYAPEAPLRPSVEGCEHCTAKAICAPFKAWLGSIEKAGRLPVAQWTDEEMDLFESRRGILEKYLKDTHEAIKLVKAANPERLPGWRLKDGANVRTVTDLVQAWAALQPLLSEGFGKDAAKKYSDCCSISIGDLEDLIYDMNKSDPKKKMSQKDTKRLLNSLLTGLIELRQNKPSLVKDE